MEFLALLPARLSSASSNPAMGNVSSLAEVATPTPQLTAHQKPLASIDCLISFSSPEALLFKL